MTLGSGGEGHTAMIDFIIYSEYSVATLTVLTFVYTHVSTFALLGVVACVLSAAAGEAILG